jgi:hypothetical protein
MLKYSNCKPSQTYKLSLLERGDGRGTYNMGYPRNTYRAHGKRPFRRHTYKGKVKIKLKLFLYLIN